MIDAAVSAQALAPTIAAALKVKDWGVLTRARQNKPPNRVS